LDFSASTGSPRRRNRLNGEIRREDARSFAVKVGQSFG